MQRYWFLDFDDTLASGVTTWVWRHALPRLIREHNLPMEPSRFQAAFLLAQERANRETDFQPIINDLFDSQGWSRTLQKPLLQDIEKNYEATLFEDTQPFLKQLHAAGRRVFIISNNPVAPQLAQKLGIDHFIEQFFTPRLCPGTFPKPHPSLWQHILSLELGNDRSNSVMVGDDPWSDAEFAESCGIDYWIIDRDDRFQDVQALSMRNRIRSLLDIAPLNV
jgi:HAD superfamily hydrolase (TIGR01549 family)